MAKVKECRKCGHVLDKLGKCSYCMNPRGGAWLPDHPFQKQKAKLAAKRKKRTKK